MTINYNLIDRFGGVGYFVKSVGMGERIMR
jgi:hypothetical protein